MVSWRKLTHSEFCQTLNFAMAPYHLDNGGSHNTCPGDDQKTGKSNQLGSLGERVTDFRMPSTNIPQEVQCKSIDWMHVGKNDNKEAGISL